MSLLIKGNINLPRNCGVCPLNCLGVCLAKNSKTDVIKYLKKRRNDCPLVEIPTPHGRLIDADQLLKHKYGVSQTARTYINTADTIIEAEVSE